MTRRRGKASITGQHIRSARDRERLRRSIRRCPAPSEFRLIFESTPDPCLVLDPQLRIIAANTAYLKATMTELHGILRRNIFDVLPNNPDDPAASGIRNLRGSFERVLKTGVTDVMEVQKYDIRVPTAVGGRFEEHFWSIITAPVLSDGGNVRYIIHRLQDVTSFMHFQRQLMEEGGDLRTSEEAETFVRSHEAAEIRAQLEHANEELARRNETLREINRCLNEEAAARRKVEAALNATNAELERSNAELNLFASVISHDLQAPLRTITSYTELLQARHKDKLDQRAKGYLHYIVDGSRRMRVMIEDLLAYSRVATTGEEFAPVQMEGVVDHALGNLHAALEQAHAEVEQEKLPEVEGDESLLTQLMQNLIANAVTFRRPEASLHIRISCQRTPDEWVFSVTDNGIGIEARFFERIFQVFQRLHTREEYEGTGMGLAICRRIVERHGGRMWVESEYGAGSTFYFTIPVRRDSNATRSEQEVFY